MLAPQKNRAGQRTYRKRDVEMALRIKELLYDDQYTIAGAKKKLASELRGASKLKVVTPEMSAQAATTQPPAIQPAPPVSRPPEISSGADMRAPSASITLSNDQRTSLRRLATELQELLIILDSGDADLLKR